MTTKHMIFFFYTVLFMLSPAWNLQKMKAKFNHIEGASTIVISGYNSMVTTVENEAENKEKSNYALVLCYNVFTLSISFFLHFCNLKAQNKHSVHRNMASINRSMIMTRTRCSQWNCFFF